MDAFCFPPRSGEQTAAFFSFQLLDSSRRCACLAIVASAPDSSGPRETRVGKCPHEQPAAERRTFRASGGKKNTLRRRNPRRSQLKLEERKRRGWRLSANRTSAGENRPQKMSPPLRQTLLRDLLKKNPTRLLLSVCSWTSFSCERSCVDF